MIGSPKFKGMFKISCLSKEEFKEIVLLLGALLLKCARKYSH